MTQHTPIKRTRSPQTRQRFSIACSVRLDLLCRLIRSSSNTFTGSHQNTLENVPVIVLTWVPFSRTLMGLITLLATSTLQDSHQRFPLSNSCSSGMRALECVAHYLHVALWHWRSEKGICFYAKLPWWRNLSPTFNPARAPGQVELLHPDQ